MRSVTCMSQEGRRSLNDLCDPNEKPEEKSECSYGECRTEAVTSSVYVSTKSWYVTEWTDDVRSTEIRENGVTVCIYYSIIPSGSFLL